MSNQLTRNSEQRDCNRDRERTRDKDHLMYVSKQVCAFKLIHGYAPASPYNPDVAAFHVQRCDAHHLPSPFGERRRTCDWFVVPLRRDRHNWIDTENGRRWEKRHYLYLLRHALFLTWMNKRVNFGFDPYDLEPTDEAGILRIAALARDLY